MSTSFVHFFKYVSLQEYGKQKEALSIQSAAYFTDYRSVIEFAFNPDTMFQCVLDKSTFCLLITKYGNKLYNSTCDSHGNVLHIVTKRFVKIKVQYLFYPWGNTIGIPKRARLANHSVQFS